MFSQLNPGELKRKNSWAPEPAYTSPHSSVVLIGIGNEFRSDDGVGIHLARKLKDENIREVAILEHSGEGASLIGLWERNDAVILVDAIFSGSLPGTVTRLDLLSESLPKELKPFSTHAFGLREGIALAKNLNRLPARLIMYGIEGKCFSSGTSLSCDVCEVAEPVTQIISAELSYLVAEIRTTRNGVA